MSSVNVLIEYNLNNKAQGIKAEKATDMKDIADHAQNAIMWSFWNGQPTARPDHIVSERAQKRWHLLSFKALLSFQEQERGVLLGAKK